MAAKTRHLVLLLLYGCCLLPGILASVGTVEPLTTGNIQDAIRLWQKNQTKAAETYGGPIEKWDTSQVTSLWNAFEGAKNFAADLSGWNVSLVTSMGNAFWNTKNFAANISTWDTSQVRSMYQAFIASEHFASDLSKWNVTTVSDMEGIFLQTKNFKANVSTWDTSGAIIMAHAFRSSTNFTGDVSEWNVSTVTTLEGTFAETKSFGANVSTWDTHRVRSMESAFRDSENFTADLSKWNVSSVRKMPSCFEGSKKFGANVSGWDTSQVRSLEEAFKDSQDFASDLSSWNVSGVRNMDHIFYQARNFGGKVCRWDTSGVVDMTWVLHKAFHHPLDSHHSSTVSGLFSNSSSGCVRQGGFGCSCNSLALAGTTIKSICKDLTSGCVDMPVLKNGVAAEGLEVPAMDCCRERHIDFSVPEDSTMDEAWQEEVALRREAGVDRINDLYSHRRDKWIAFTCGTDYGLSVAEAREIWNKEIGPQVNKTLHEELASDMAAWKSWIIGIMDHRESLAGIG